MNIKFTGLNQSIDKKIKTACNRIPEKKRKFIVLILCFLFLAIFVVMLWNSFQSEGVQKLIEIEHITPLDLPQDTIVKQFKQFINGYK
jgi:TRAP-type C4-dicarboxylate transport system permease small subunit